MPYGPHEGETLATWGYDMNKNLIIAVVVLVLAVGGYYQFVSKPAKEAAAAVQAEADAAAAVKAEADAAAAKVAEEAAAAAKAAEEAAAAATAAATTAATDATAAVTTALDDLLKPENFDAAKITAAIDASPLDAATKTTLKTAVEKAKATPALLPAVLEQVKAALSK